MESQIGYIVETIKTLRNQKLRLLDVKPEVQAHYNRAIQKRLARTNWNSGCKSWYLTEDGYNATMYPGFATQYAAQMSSFNAKHYRTETVG